MKGQKNNGYYRLQRGAVLPKELLPAQEGIRFSFDGKFTLMYAFDRPTVEEKQAFKSGNPCQFGLAVVDDVIFFLSRFGTLKWMDAPFNIHLYPDNRARLLEVPGPTQGYAVYIMLVDSSTGIIEQLRLTSLTHDLSMRLRDAIINQPVIPDYDQRLQSIMARYSTEDLVALASKGQDSMATITPPQLRPSQRGLSGIKKDNYPLPEELRKFNFYYIDSGHVVMAIPESLLPCAIKSGNLDDFECPIPCRYILAKGYRFHEGYVVCDAPYSREFGLGLDSFWYTW